MSGLSETAVENDEARPIKTAVPAKATPNDCPRFCAVPCKPPASLLRDSSTDERLTLPICEMASPTPTPMEVIAIAKSVPLASGVIAPISNSSPRHATMMPSRISVLGG